MTWNGKVRNLIYYLILMSKKQRINNKKLLLEELLTVFDTNYSTREEILSFLHLIISLNRSNFKKKHLDKMNPNLQIIYNNFIERKVDNDYLIELEKLFKNKKMVTEPNIFFNESYPPTENYSISDLLSGKLYKPPRNQTEYEPSAKKRNTRITNFTGNDSDATVYYSD